MDAARMMKMARRRAGLSQRELSRRANVPQATISRIENALVSPTVDTLDPLIRACGMELLVDEAAGAGVDRSQLVERLRLSPAQRATSSIAAASGVRRFREAFGISQTPTKAR
jgi:transcriptional regulator with XRE-family HTH domain